MTDRNARRPGSAEKTVRDFRRATRWTISAEIGMNRKRQMGVMQWMAKRGYFAA
jgi:hypothetical protein